MRNYLRVRGEYGGRHASENHAKELPPRARRIRLHHPRHHLHAGTTSACAENTTVGTISNIRRGNYLRVRGEYLLSSVGPLLSSELPPRARRIPAGASADLHTVGTTSACAENTLCGVPLLTQNGNYLRVRGEYRYPDGEIPVDWELPPRARRILTFTRDIEGLEGTTSACAENTCSRGCIPRRLRNYLRVRGEYPQSRHQSWRR